MDLHNSVKSFLNAWAPQCHCESAAWVFYVDRDSWCQCMNPRWPQNKKHHQRECYKRKQFFDYMLYVYLVAMMYRWFGGCNASKKGFFYAGWEWMFGAMLSARISALCCRHGLSIADIEGSRHQGADLESRRRSSSSTFFQGRRNKVQKQLDPHWKKRDTTGLAAIQSEHLS